MNDELVKPCIWYVSKYVNPPSKGSAGGRGYLLMREIAKQGFQCVIIASDSNMLGDISANKEVNRPGFTGDSILSSNGVSGKPGAIHCVIDGEAYGENRQRARISGRSLC